MRKKKKVIPKKPTKEERGILRRLRKHETAAAPAYEKKLGDKYTLKKKAVSAGKGAPAKK